MATTRRFSCATTTRTTSIKAKPKSNCLNSLRDPKTRSSLAETLSRFKATFVQEWKCIVKVWRHLDGELGRHWDINKREILLKIWGKWCTTPWRGHTRKGVSRCSVKTFRIFRPSRCYHGFNYKSKQIFNFILEMSFLRFRDTCTADMMFYADLQLGYLNLSRLRCGPKMIRSATKMRKRTLQNIFPVWRGHGVQV